MRIGTSEPLHAAAPGEDDQDRRRSRDVDRSRGRAEPRVQRGETFGQRALRRKPLEHVLGVAERGVGGRRQHQHRRDDEADCQDVAQPARRGQMLRKTSQRAR